MKRTEWMVTKPRLGRPPKRTPLPPEVQALADEFAERLEMAQAEAVRTAMRGLLDSLKAVADVGRGYER